MSRILICNLKAVLLLALCLQQRQASLTKILLQCGQGWCYCVPISCEFEGRGGGD